MAAENRWLAIGNGNNMGNVAYGGICVMAAQRGYPAWRTGGAAQLAQLAGGYTSFSVQLMAIQLSASMAAGVWRCKLAHANGVA